MRLSPPVRPAHWHDGVVVQRGVGREVVGLDVVHVGGAAYARHLVQLPHVVGQVGVVADEVPVGLEVHHVHLVKPDERHVQPDVRLRDAGPSDVALLGKDALAPVQRAEQLPEGLLVRGLLGGEAAAVHAVVDAGVHPLVDRVDLSAQGLRVQVQLRVLGQVVEGRVEHAQDLAALVVHDGPLLLVPQHRHRVAASLLPRLLIQLPHGLGAVDGVRHARVTGEGALAR
mmetsp:Transcript_20502/g.51984  ORF Transcript_20502/g.51984 Transcript_20502/m.51984 type:complete len:228 (-) Transcript_20502:394-1077(-)